MAKNIRRMFAMVLVMCMILSALPMQALAAEGDGIVTEGPVVENTADGLTVTTTTTTETKTDGANTTVTVTIEKATEGTSTEGTKVDNKETATTTTTENSETGASSESTVVVETKKEETADGVKTDYQQTSTENTTVEADGTVKESSSVDGTEKKEWTEEDTGDGKQPSVVAPIVPGEEATATGGVTEETVTNEDGSVTTTTTTDRTVTTNTSDINVTVNDVDSGLVGEDATDIQGLAPVYDTIDGKKEDKGGMFDYQFNSGATSTYANPSNWDMPEGADLRYVGTGEHSKYYVATAYVVYEKDDAGNTIYDSEGKPVIKEIRRYSDEDSAIITVDNEPLTELPDNITLEPIYDNYGGSRPFIFMLMDENKNKFYGYCCDLETDAGDGKYYTISNLEDSDYYASEESAQHIRSILMNGYLGTTGIPDENGDYALGSLELIKQKLIAAIDSGEYPNTELTAPVLDRNNKYQPVKDENGEIVYATKTMKEMIEGLTSGEALLATQAAVWTYANGSYNVLNGKDGSIILDPDGYKWNHDAMGNSKTAGGYTNGEAMDDFASAAVDFLYTWLINLQTQDESTVIINEKNNVEDISITVHDKVTEVEGAKVEANFDDNTDNDVYNTDLNFKLAFVPGPNDDLLVQVTYTDFDGTDRTVVRRLAGDQEDYAKVDYDETTGSYVLKGLVLSENNEFNFDLRLEGTQYLENGVYIYEAFGGRHASQNFVGVAEGERNVDVSVGVTIKFDVDENNHVVAERKWHYEGDPGSGVPGDGEPTPVNDEGEPVAPQVFRLNNQDNLEEIPEEPVPLAAPAITGDNSGLWVAVILLSLFCMVAVNVFDKKRQHEAF